MATAQLPLHKEKSSNFPDQEQDRIKRNISQSSNLKLRVEQ